MSQAPTTTASARPPYPKVGEVWQVNLEPVAGSEQSKTRPVVVMSEPPTGRATIRLCAPIIHRKPLHARLFWCIDLWANATNGLTKASSADAAQARALDVVRFEAKLGQVTPHDLEATTTALCLCVGRVPRPAPAEAKE